MHKRTVYNVILHLLHLKHNHVTLLIYNFPNNTKLVVCAHVHAYVCVCVCVLEHTFIISHILLISFRLVCKQQNQSNLCSIEEI